MMITKNRNYRSFEVRASEEGAFVEGYALVFDTEEVMYEYDGIAYKEQIRSGALDSTLMQDVVLNFNHGGKPVARTKNGTLELRVDPVGLFVRADLSGTEEGRRLYEEVKGGYLDKMSFAFTINADEYNKEQHLRTITEVKRIYDVAIVDIPAYESTSVQARSFFEVEAEKERAEARNALELAKAKYFYGGTE
jgi:HK97 family phage prohead protease